MASILPNGKNQFTDSNGRPLIGGKVFFYVPNTETKKDTWQDSAMTVPNTNPITLDGRGEAAIWGTGKYRQVLYDAKSNLIWDMIVSAPVTYTDSSGSTINRPSEVYVGMPFFDTTLNEPIWCASISPITWVNAAGVSV